MPRKLGEEPTGFGVYLQQQLIGSTRTLGNKQHFPLALQGNHIGDNPQPAHPVL